MDNQNQPTQQAQPIEIPEELKLFFQGILQEADIFIADDEDLQELLQNMYAHFNTQVTSTIIEHLPEDKIDGFLDLEEKGGNAQQELQTYIEQNVPNAKDVIGKAYEDFSNLYLDAIAIEDARMEAMEKDDKNAASIQAIQKLATGEHPAQHATDNG